MSEITFDSRHHIPSGKNFKYSIFEDLKWLLLSFSETETSGFPIAKTDQKGKRTKFTAGKKENNSI